MTTRLAHAAASRLDHVHGDEDQGEPYSPEEEAFIAHRTQELLAERLNDRIRFRDLLSGIDATEIEPHLHRALMNLDAACKGNQDAYFGITSALAIIQRTVRQEARAVWADECRAEAELQLMEES